MDKLSKEQRSKLMGKIRGKETKEEVALAKALWKLGYRYRKNNRKIKGTPDLSFAKFKVAIFVDGEFWHGHNWIVRKEKIKSNIEFWHAKIERNIARDIEVNTYLEEKGWTVLRFWSTEVKKNLPEVIDAIETAIQFRKSQPKVYLLSKADALPFAAEPERGQ